MPITADQRADIGTRYLAHLLDRIIKRQSAKKKADADRKAYRVKADRALHPAARAWLATHELTGPITSVSYCSGTRPRVHVETDQGEHYLNVSLLPECLLHKKELDRLDDLRGSLCKEVEFLTPLTRTSGITGFQAFAGKLWAPSVNDEHLPETLFRKLIEDYLQSRRPAVCNV